MTSQPIIRLESVERTFEARGQTITAVDDVSVDISPGQFFTIVGPSGCGKSTILNMIVGLLAPTAGRISYRGHPIQGITGDIGYVTQDDNLYPWRTLRKNIEFGMEVRGVGRQEREGRAKELIDRTGLQGFEESYRHELSGGMRARANIARTLAWRPEVILMDEPFGPLDVQTRLQLQALLLDLWDEEGSTVIFITHDLTEAVSLSDEVLVMTKHPGRVKKLYDIDLARPRDIFSIQTTDAFRAVYDPLWELLREEMRPETVRAS